MMRSLVTQLPLLLAISTLLFLVVWFLCRLAGDRAPHLRLVLWAIVLAKLVIPPSVMAIWTVESSWLGSLEPHHLYSAPATAAASGAESVAGPVDGSGLVIQFIAAVWVAGAVISLGRWLVARRRQLQHVRKSAVGAEPSTLAILREWTTSLQIRREVRILVSPDTAIAFTAGVLQPTIYLPAEVEERLPVDALATVVAHEVAHVKRLDDLWLAIEAVVRSIYFFHPVVWLTTARLREVREQLADELVIDSGRIDGRLYGNILLDAVSLQRRSTTMPALVESSREALERRLVRLGRYQRPRHKLIGVASGIAFAALLLPAGLDAAQSSVPGAVPTLQHPLPDARVTSPFGPRRDPFSNIQSVHSGVDFAAARDTLVLAAAPGRVIIATERYEPAPAQGTVVIISHGGDLRTFSSHLGELLVKEGEIVSAGQPIARVGSSGRVTGPHLHFEVIQGSDPVDPLPLISSGGGE